MKEYAGLGGKADDDATTVCVALFTEEECDIRMKSDLSSIGWAIKTRSKGANSFKVIMSPHHMRCWWGMMIQNPSSPCVEFHLDWFYKMFRKLTKARPLKSLSAPIHACVGDSRPEVLYRVVHGEQPGNGLQSRGFHSIEADTLTFMLHFVHHLNWKRRDPSPFMSTTTEPCKAATIASLYQRKGFKNIEVLIIQVGGSDWPVGSMMWDVRQTAAALGLDDVLSKPFYDHEYLVENYIPEACVTRLRWEDMKADIDAEMRLMDNSKKRKRSVFESNVPGDETHASDGRKCARRTWNLVEKRSQFSLPGEPKYYYTRRDNSKTPVS